MVQVVKLLDEINSYKPVMAEVQKVISHDDGSVACEDTGEIIEVRKIIDSCPIPKGENVIAHQMGVIIDGKNEIIWIV